MQRELPLSTDRIAHRGEGVSTGENFEETEES